MSDGNTNNTVFIQKLFTSRDNFTQGNVQEATANALAFVGQEDRIWWEPTTNQFYYSDGNTPGGLPIGGGNAGNGNPGGPVNSIQYNAGGTTFGGTGNLTISGNGMIAVGNISAAYFIGSGNNLSNIQGANVTGTVANANYATFAGTAYAVSGANVSGEVANANYATLSGTAYSVAVANVSGIGNIAVINLDGSSSNILYGNGVFGPDTGPQDVANANYANFAGTAYSVSGANVSGEVANANYATFAGTAYAVSGANVSGEVANANYATFAGTAYSVSGANVSGEVANANYAVFSNTAYSVAGANVSGEVANANYATYSGTAYAVSGANVSGEVANANYSTYSGTAYSVAGANVSGEVANANYATYSGTAYSVAGANVSGEVANANYAAYAGTILTNAQPNITSVGDLSNLVVTGNSDANIVNANYFYGDGSNISNLTLTGYAAGNTTEIQFNATGNFSASPNLTFANNTLTTGNVIPVADNTYFLGDSTHRWANLWIGPGTIYITDSNVASGLTAELTVLNGVLQINGADQLQVGQLKFVDNTIESITPNIDIQIGLTSASANLLLNRNTVVDSSKTLYTGDIVVTGNLTVSSDQIPDNIDVNGTNYSASFVVNDTGADHIAQTLLTRFSTSVQPIIATALNNSDDPTANADVVNGQTLFQLATLGFAGTDYKEFGGIAVLVDDNGTVSETSSPGKMDFRVTPDGSVNTNTALTIFNDSTSVFYGLVNVNGTILGRNAPTTAAGASGDLSGMVAFDLNYMYYCYQDFATAAGSNIWARTQNTKNWA